MKRSTDSVTAASLLEEVGENKPSILYGIELGLYNIIFYILKRKRVLK